MANAVQVLDAQPLKHSCFCKLNLKNLFQFDDPFDIILCRNVLIYQSMEGKKAVVAGAVIYQLSDALASAA